MPTTKACTMSGMLKQDLLDLERCDVDAADS
jgi:hypothetical protein